MRRRVALVWFGSVSEGTAPKYHLRGTRRRLVSEGIADNDVIEVTRDSANGRRGIISLFGRSLFVGFKVKNVVARYHPLMLPWIVAWRLQGCHVILLVQGTFDDAVAAHPIYGTFRLLRWSAHLGLRLGHAHLAAHDGIARWTAEVTHGEVQVIPNGPPLLGPRPESPEPSPHLPFNYVVFAGALAPWQGIETLLAARAMPSWPDPVELVIIGDGRMRPLIEQDTSGAIYLGRRDPHQVREVLRNSLASLSPKRLDEVTSKGISPFKLIEAGIEGKPIIASRVPGQTEYVSKFGCGLLIDPDSPEQLAGAVARIWGDPELRQQLGDQGRVGAAYRSWERHARLLGDQVK